MTSHPNRTSVTLQQLRVFTAIAQRGSLAGAANAQGLSEPTVSSHLSTLERLVGAMLLERSRGRRPIVLTEAGRSILQTCDKLFAVLDDGLERAWAQYGPDRTTISVGATPQFGAGVLPQLIELFSREQPSITVKIEIDQPSVLLERVKRGRLDLVVCFGPIDDDQVVVEPFCWAQLALLGKRDHRLSQGSPAPWHELDNERIIMGAREGSARHLLQRLAAERGVSLHVVMDSDDVYARIQAMANGLGIGPMYLDTAAAQLASGELAVLNLEGLPLQVQRLIVYPRTEMPRAARDFRDLMLRSRSEIEARTSLLTPA